MNQYSSCPSCIHAIILVNSFLVLHHVVAIISGAQFRAYFSSWAPIQFSISQHVREAWKGVIPSKGSEDSQDLLLPIRIRHWNNTFKLLFYNWVKTQLYLVINNQSSVSRVLFQFALGETFSIYQERWKATTRKINPRWLYNLLWILGFAVCMWRLTTVSFLFQRGVSTQDLDQMSDFPILEVYPTNLHSVQRSKYH